MKNEGKARNREADKRKRAVLTTTLALLTAASVVTGSLFDSPAALLPDDGAPSIVYNVNNGLDGADDDDAGLEEEDSEETRRRGGIRSILRQRILQLPLIVRLLVILPLWALGSVILAGAGAAWTALSPVLGHVAGFALMLGLLAGSFVLAAKSVFPDLPVKKLLTRRSLTVLLIGAAALTAADAILPTVWLDYARIKNAVMSVGFLLVLSCAAVPFVLREQKRRLKAATAEKPKKAADAEKRPETLTFTDAGGTFTVTIPNRSA